MISFKGVHFPKDVILYAVISMSGMVYLIVALGAKKINVLWLLRGGWMKPISKLKGSGSIYIEPLINSATPLILCFPSVEMKRRLTGSQRK
jgi:hypothetical protein